MLLAATKRLLGPFAFSSVAADGVNDEFVRRRRRCPLDPSVGPVLGAGAEFIGNDGGTGFQSLEFSRRAFAVIRMHHIVIRHGLELLHRVSDVFYHSLMC